MNLTDGIEKRLELDRYYKRVIKCPVCKKIYGSDRKHDKKICPICEYKIESVEEK